ncbi:hypothetical protein L6452_02941 [Arctium lappa]|uniref:Uncharacterized protein n=1 Tax=Arctium lappa TaxID=4217 RepID=A0ACB9FKA4_ARCLA|nr:hypothetical protein L6452_02941 [Arctium lappa]
MDSSKFAFQAMFYTSDLMMSLGTETRPPVLVDENEFTQWQDRFMNFIERQANGENMMKSLTERPFINPNKETPPTPEEASRMKANRELKANLMLALPNSVYNRVDHCKDYPNMLWTQLEKIMLGSSVATQLRHTRFMNNFEEFNAKENETIKSVFDIFCVVLNDLRKLNVIMTELETNLKFLNALQPEWNKSCHRLRNDVRISTMQIQELYEILMTDESLVLEKKAKMDKKKKTVDPVALLTKQLSEQALSENAYTGSTEDDGEALQKAMILFSQHYQKKFQPKSGSNSSRFTSGPKVKVPELKNVACYNCGKPGHMSKECRAKVVRDSAYYRKKVELAEKRENGTALMAEEEFWLDHSDDEASNVEIAQICLVGDDQSDDSDFDTDEDEVYSEFDYKFITSQFDIMINALYDLRSKILSEKVLNSEKSDLIEKLKISLKDEKSILENTKDIFQKKLDALENSNKTYLESLTDMTKLKDKFSDKIIKLEEKFYRRDQYEQTIYMNKLRSEEALKQRWGLGFDNPQFFKQNRALSARSKKQIWKAKLNSMFDGDRCVDKFYNSDSFAVCNNVSKYSIKQMFQISKNVSYSSSDSSSDDLALSSDSCDYFFDHIPRALNLKSAHYFSIRTATNKHGSKFKWVPKSLSDSKLQASHVEGDFSQCFKNMLRCLISNIYMTKLIKIIKVMRGRSQGEVKETKNSNVYLLIKIHSKILFSQLQQILLLFLLRTPQFIQDHSKELSTLVRPSAWSEILDGMSTFSRSPSSPRRRLVFLKSVDLGMFGSIPVGSWEMMTFRCWKLKKGSNCHPRLGDDRNLVGKGYFEELNVRSVMSVMCPRGATDVSTSIRVMMMILTNGLRTIYSAGNVPLRRVDFEDKISFKVGRIVTPRISKASFQVNTEISSLQGKNKIFDFGLESLIL